MMSTFLRNLTFILFSLLLLPATAAPQQEEKTRYYDVELIVFENQAVNKETTTPEIWKVTADLAVPEKTVVLGKTPVAGLNPQYDPKYSFTMLDKSALLLQDELKTLKQSEQYKILLHTGWRQPGMPREEALNVFFKHAITADDADAGVFSPIEVTAAPEPAPHPVPTQPAAAQPTPDTGSVAGGDPAFPAADNPAMEETQPPQITNLQGLIKIVLSRYLHTDIELIYKKASETGSVDRFDSGYLDNRQGKNEVYYLKQNRRMRSKELHYIDHPVIGVLVKITPFEVPIETPPVTNQPATPGAARTKVPG
ncbi:MAG: CsiV family protein [Gammaproteobacteria bacterium]|nr:CsiV family protein [Gammaproteobacteria bacterium]MDH5652622.1 CsiV family protein [Gammaproteobacteria bacterium]